MWEMTDWKVAVLSFAKNSWYPGILFFPKVRNYRCCKLVYGIYELLKFDVYIETEYS